MNKLTIRAKSVIKKTVGWSIALAVIWCIFEPVFQNVRDTARRISCESNLKYIGAALIQYTQDNDGYPPPVDPNNWNHTWRNTLLPYLPSPDVYRCPSRTHHNMGPDGLADNYSVSYTKNGFFVPAGSPRIRYNDVNTDTLIVVCETHDSGPTFNIDSPMQAFEQRPSVAHFSGSNYLFLDGHVKWKRPKDTYEGYEPGQLNNCWYRDNAIPPPTIAQQRINNAVDN